jgi:hypothetical protein
MKNSNRADSRSRIAELLNYYDEEKRKAKASEQHEITTDTDSSRKPLQPLAHSQQRQPTQQNEIVEVDSDEINDFMENLKRGCYLERLDDESDEGTDFLLMASNESPVSFIQDQYDVGSNQNMDCIENCDVDLGNSRISNAEIFILPNDSDQDVEAILSEDDLEHIQLEDVPHAEEYYEPDPMPQKNYIYFASDSQEEEDKAKPSSLTLIYRDVVPAAIQSSKTSTRSDQKRVTFSNTDVYRESSAAINEINVENTRTINRKSGELTLNAFSGANMLGRNEKRNAMENFIAEEKLKRDGKRNGIENYIVEDIIADVQNAVEDVVDEKFNNSHLQVIPKIVAVDIWSESINNVTKGLQQLAEIAMIGQGQKDILASGGHLAIVVVMKRWSNSSDVVIEACNALEKASRFTSQFAEAAVNVGALEVILYYMSVYSNDERVQAYGCSALCALAWSRPAAELFVFQLNGIKTFYQAMTTFPYCTLLMQNACRYFNHLSMWEDYREPVVVAGILGAISRAIETYTSEENDEKIIQLNAREAVQRLVS